jgi:hypothetical protein
MLMAMLVLVVKATSVGRRIMKRAPPRWVQRTGAVLPHVAVQAPPRSSTLS